MKRTVWLLVGILVLLHQDYWQWDNASLWFGFLPYTLAYHAGLSLLAAAAWWLATCCFWPHQLEVATLSDAAAADPGKSPGSVKEPDPIQGGNAGPGPGEGTETRADRT